MMGIEELKALYDARQWSELARQSGEYADANPASEAGHLFLASAQKELGQTSEALDHIDSVQRMFPQSHWAASLRFSMMLDEGQVEEALRRYRDYLLTYPGDEVGMATYVMVASEHGLFEQAGEMNARRSVIQPRPRAKFALAVQTFIKADTLTKLFDHLLDVEEAGDFALVILCDGLEGSKKREQYAPLAKEVDSVIEAYATRLSKAFASLEIVRNERNLGTAPSCRRLLDHVAEKFEAFLFIEDDCLLAPQALRWTKHCLDNVIDPETCWFATCESVLFDAQRAGISATDAERVRAYAADYEGHYSLIDFVPSTCFMTSSAIWQRVANIRSFTRGPESLTRYMRTLGMRTLAPVVPYAADIGMEHPLGYSSQTLGANQIKEWKSTYVMAEKPFDQGMFASVSAEEFDRLFKLSVMMDRQAIDSLPNA